MKMLAKIKSLILATPDQINVPIYFVYKTISKKAFPFRISKENGLWKVKSSSTFYFPKFPHIGQIKKVEENYSDLMLEKYTSKGFVEISPEDTVIDVGAFVGAFSIASSRVAKQVIANEPVPKTYHALKQNTNNFKNIKSYEQALWNETKELTFNIGKDYSDNSALDVDDGENTGQINVKGKNFSEFINEECEDDEDLFIKIDAEGAEPEVLQGLEQDERIKKIAVDCTPERNGESPKEEVTNLLKGKGYTIKSRNKVVFAKLEM